MATSYVHRKSILDTSTIPGQFGIINWKPLSGLKWMQMNWHYSIYVSFIYICVIFSVRRKMNKHKEGFKLRSTLAIWNSCLCIFSITGSYFMIPEMIQMISTSFYHSVCYSSTDEHAQYWMWLFAMSKVIELGDTLFIVLRKKKLIFLHYIHHILALIYTWYSVSQNISLGRWFVTMNYVVHSIMYGYYAARSLQWFIPRGVAMIITSLQIIQMILGFYVSFYAFKSKLFGTYCEIPMKTATLGFGVYLAFFYMFAQFFVVNYMKKNKHHDKDHILAPKNDQENKMVPKLKDELIMDARKRHLRHGSISVSQKTADFDQNLAAKKSDPKDSVSRDDGYHSIEKLN